jgi:hypothetical protein
MRTFGLGMLILFVFMGGTAVRSETRSTAVQQAQERVWRLQDQLADAHYHLAALHLTEDSNRLQADLRKVDTSRNPKKISEIQSKLSDVDRKRLVEQQRLQWTHQLVTAERSGDRTAAESIRARLKALH